MCNSYIRHPSYTFFPFHSSVSLKTSWQQLIHNKTIMQDFVHCLIYTHFSIYADLVYAFLELRGCRINTIFFNLRGLFLGITRFELRAIRPR
jgi:hypothetical protein